ncbi:MAG TPA: CsgG/HfaB family protein [Luteimonas sp.]|nr:CsgG/HfaB family protein [Luteimonas sp.]
MLRPCLLLIAVVLTLPIHAQEQAPAPATSSIAADSTTTRPILGVLKFQDETGAMFLQGGAGRAMTTMLTNELSARPVFEIVERQKIRAVMEEQNLSASGRVSPETSIAIGKLTGAQYLVTGTVTAFEEKVDTKVKRGFMGVGGSIKTVSEGGYLAVDLRVIDTTTGEIHFARTIEGHTPPGETKDGPASPLGGGPDSRAVRAAVIEIVDYLECAMVKRDACLAEFDARDKQRQDETRKAMQIQH